MSAFSFPLFEVGGSAEDHPEKEGHCLQISAFVQFGMDQRWVGDVASKRLGDVDRLRQMQCPIWKAKATIGVLARRPF